MRATGGRVHASNIRLLSLPQPFFSGLVTGSRGLVKLNGKLYPGVSGLGFTVRDGMLVVFRLGP